jgi:TRAP-type C4-dicarboxylate transport system permease large subunit
MYGFAHGVMAGVIITFVLAVFTLIWIYIEQCQTPKKREVKQVPDTKEEEFSSFMVVLLMGAMFTILLLIGWYFAVAY